MDPRSVTLCFLHAALKWPERLPELLRCADAPPTPDPVYACLWRAIRKTQASGLHAAPDLFRQQVLFAVKSDAPAYSGAVAQLIRHVSESEVPTQRFCLDSLKSYAAQRVLENYEDLDTPGAVDRVIASLSHIRDLNTGSSPAPLDLFAEDGEQFLLAEPKIRLGFPLFDCPFGGLPPSETLTMLVSPLKSCKTLLSIQLAKCMVAKMLDVLYMNFEQRAKGNLATRVYLMASDSRKSDWEGVESFSQLKPDVRARLEAGIPAWRQHFFPYAAESFDDPSALNHGADSIKKILLDNFARRGRPIPSLIILDWWRDMWDRVKAAMMASGRRMDGAEMRSQELAHFLMLKRMAQDLGTRVFVLMQMAAAVATSKQADNISNLTCGNAAENRMLSAYVDSAFVSTRLNVKDHTITYKLDVSRDVEPGYIQTFTLDGDAQLLVPMDPSSGMETLSDFDEDDEDTLE